MAILNRSSLAKEAARRSKASIVKPIVLDPNFKPQNEFINDTSRYIAAQCSRRAGKTNGLAIRFKQTMDRHPGSTCLYLAMTQDSAREIMWPVLQEFNNEFGLGWEFTESKLTVSAPNGSKLKLIGADMKNFVKRLKGRKHPGIGLDEAQDFGTHLQSLIDDVLTPCIADYSDGWLALTGTPGPVPTGYFFDVTQNKKYGYSYHAWTILDNPYMPDPHAFIENLKQVREWTNDNPTLRREWRNEWVLDTQSLWIRYSEKLNHYQQLPNYRWTYILGIDIGYRDADALAVLAWSDETPAVYLVEEVITTKQGLTELADQIKALDKKYNISNMVIDAGGLGKKLAEELRRQYLIPVQDADKMRKQENVELLNDAMRTSRFMAKSASRFAKDSYLIQIDWEKTTPNKIVIKKNPHSDIIDSVLYAFKISPAWSYTKPEVKPKYGTKEWQAEEQSKQFDLAMEFFQAAKEDGKGPWGDFGNS